MLHQSGSGPTTKYHIAVHTHDTTLDTGNWQSVNGDITTDFHTYSALWTSTDICFYIDGALSGSVMRGELEMEKELVSLFLLFLSLSLRLQAI